MEAEAEVTEQPQIKLATPSLYRIRMMPIYEAERPEIAKLLMVNFHVKQKEADAAQAQAIELEYTDLTLGRYTRDMAETKRDNVKLYCELEKLIMRPILVEMRES